MQVVALPHHPGGGDQDALPYLYPARLAWSPTAASKAKTKEKDSKIDKEGEDLAKTNLWYVSYVLYVMLSYGMLCYVMYAMLCYVKACFVMLM